MTDITIQIDSPKVLADRMDYLKKNWQSIAFKALGETLHMDNVLGSIRRRTPRSELDSKWNLDENGKRILDRSHPGPDGYVPGMNNLRNDLTIQPLTDGMTSRSFLIGFPNVKYAWDVHERDDSRTHWTHEGTGSHYLSGVIEAEEDNIPLAVMETIDIMLKEAGVI